MSFPGHICDNMGGSRGWGLEDRGPDHPGKSKVAIGFLKILVWTPLLKGGSYGPL